MTYAGNYPNPIATLPVGTHAEIKQEVSHAVSYTQGAKGPLWCDKKMCCHCWYFENH